MKTSTPCIRNCCLDFDDICVGCFRSLEEIKAWSKLSEPERKRLMAQLPERARLRALQRKKQFPDSG
jgi:hypothetical protein